MTKMSSALTSVLLMMLVVLTGACSRSNKEQRQHAEEMVREWTGKAIQLPDSLSLINGNMYYAKDADFTILSYIDSAGCTACHLKLPFWKQYLPLVDSLSGTSVVRFLFVIQPKSHQDLKQIAERAQFQYPIHADTANAIAIANRFPEELEYSTFLLDRNHRVLAIGNPVLNKSIKKVYLDIVGKRKIDRSTVIIESEYFSIMSLVLLPIKPTDLPASLLTSLLTSLLAFLGRVKTIVTVMPLLLYLGVGNPTRSHSFAIMDSPRPQCSMRPPIYITFAMTGFGGIDVFALSFSSSSIRVFGESLAGKRPAFTLFMFLSQFS